MMKTAIFVLIANFFGGIGIAVEEELEIPPEVLVRFQQRAEQRQRELVEEHRKKKVEANLAWRAKWIPDELAEDPSNYYFTAWLRAREAEKAIREEKTSLLTDAIEVLENLRIKAPEWKPEMVEKRLKNLREMQLRLTD